MKNERSTFSGKLGFVLAAAGSAVGLGNIWRFPYLAAKYGGGIFLLVYIILSVTFGFSLMIAEIVIGRKTKLSPVEAYKALDDKIAALEARCDGLQTFIIVVCIISAVALCGCVTLAVFFIVDKKKKI